MCGSIHHPPQALIWTSKVISCPLLLIFHNALNAPSSPHQHDIQQHRPPPACSSTPASKYRGSAISDSPPTNHSPKFTRDIQQLIVCQCKRSLPLQRPRFILVGSSWLFSPPPPDEPSPPPIHPKMSLQRPRLARCREKAQISRHRLWRRHFRRKCSTIVHGRKCSRH